MRPLHVQFLRYGYLENLHESLAFALGIFPPRSRNRWLVTTLDSMELMASVLQELGVVARVRGGFRYTWPIPPKRP